MCKCAGGFHCDNDQERATKTLQLQLQDSNELLEIYRNLAIIQEQEIERLHIGIDAIQRRLLISEYTPCT